MLKSGEIWMIVSFSENYEISTYGNVRRADTHKFLKQYDNGIGYKIIRLNNGNKYKNYYIHRLVAEAFLYNMCDYLEVNHIDGNKQNNHISNLEWCSRKQNISHAFSIGLSTSNVKGKFGKLHHNSKTVYQYNINLELIKTWDCVMDIERTLKLRNGHISECCYGKRSQVGGYIWRYKEEQLCQH